MRSLQIRVALVSAFGIAAPVAAALAPAAGQASPARQADPSCCIVVVEKTVQPRVLLLGDSTTATLRVIPMCPAELMPTHVSFVMEASANMAGQPLADMQHAARWLVEGLDLDNNLTAWAAVTAFNSQADNVLPLSNQERRVLAAIGKLEASGGVAIEKGLEVGMQQLAASRTQRRAPPQEVLVLFSTGRNDLGCEKAQQAARRAKGESVLVVAVGVGPDRDADCLRSLATSPRHYFPIEEIGPVERLVAPAHRVQEVFLKSLTVRDLPAAGFRFVPGSARPAPRTVDPVTGELVCQYPLRGTSRVPVEGITITYRVEALEPGYQLTSERAGFEFVDSTNRVGAGAITVPAVHVLRPYLVSTPTPRGGP